MYKGGGVIGVVYEGVGGGKFSMGFWVVGDFGVVGEVVWGIIWFRYVWRMEVWVFGSWSNVRI